MFLSWTIRQSRYVVLACDASGIPSSFPKLSNLRLPNHNTSTTTTRGRRRNRSCTPGSVIEMASPSALDLSEANFQDSPLLRLPQELIDHIINLIVIPLLSRSPARPRQSQTRPAKPRSEQRARAALIKKLMPIMRICRKLRADSGNIIYSRDYEYWNELDWSLKHWIEDIAGECRCYIRKMRNAMVSAGSMEDARVKAAELDEEHGLRTGTSWVLSYLPHENQQSGFKQFWVNSRGKKELFEPVEFIYGPGIHMDKT